MYFEEAVVRIKALRDRLREKAADLNGKMEDDDTCRYNDQMAQVREAEEDARALDVLLEDL